MKLTLTTNSGTVLQEWEIERDFGDILKPLPCSTMVDDVTAAYKREKARKEVRDAN